MGPARSVVPSPSIGPTGSFWFSTNNFGRVQITEISPEKFNLNLTKIIWTQPNDQDLTKKIWTFQNHFGPKDWEGKKSAILYSRFLIMKSSEIM